MAEASLFERGGLLRCPPDPPKHEVIEQIFEHVGEPTEARAVPAGAVVAHDLNEAASILL